MAWKTYRVFASRGDAPTEPLQTFRLDRTLDFREIGAVDTDKSPAQVSDRDPFYMAPIVEVHLKSGLSCRITSDEARRFLGDFRDFIMATRHRTLREFGDSNPGDPLSCSSTP